jgi:hypothetical protein
MQGRRKHQKIGGGGGGGGAPASKALLDNEKAPKNIFPEMLATGEGKFSNHIIFHA